MIADKKKPTHSGSEPLQMGRWYRFLRGIFGFLIRVVCRIEVEGLENVPGLGPYLVVVNHLHWLDAPLVMTVYPYRAHVFAAEKWEKHWFLGRLMNSLDAIYVQRGEVDRKALRKALKVLRGGGVLGVAPEGTRSRTGEMQKGRSGAAYMSIHTGARILPMAITGQEDVFSALRRFRRARVRIIFGKPFESSHAATGRATSAQVHAFADEIMYCLAALLPAQYRGVYGDVAEKRPDLMTIYALGGDS